MTYALLADAEAEGLEDTSARGQLAGITVATDSARGLLASAVLTIPQRAPVDAGLDQLNVEPWSTVTLTATSSVEPDTWQWRQISGPAVTITAADQATATFTAPADVVDRTLVFSVTAADSTGTSVDTVQVRVLAALDRVIVGMQQVPVRWLAVT